MRLRPLREVLEGRHEGLTPLGERTGEGEPGHYRINPPMIAVPLGPEAGAGQLPGVEGVAGPEVVSNVKGRALFVEMHTASFAATA